MRAWWRRNRWGLIALPIVAVVLLVASSYRVADMWWNDDLRIEVDRAAPGEEATLPVPAADAEPDPVTAEYPATIPLTMRLEGIEERGTVSQMFEEERLPDGVSGYAVELELSADEQIAGGCNVILVGTDGSRYGDATSDPLWQGGHCIPEDLPLEVPGPSGQWRVAPVILGPAELEIDHVIVTTDRHRYVVLEVEG